MRHVQQQLHIIFVEQVLCVYVPACCYLNCELPTSNYMLGHYLGSHASCWLPRHVQLHVHNNIAAAECMTTSWRCSLGSHF